MTQSQVTRRVTTVGSDSSEQLSQPAQCLPPRGRVFVFVCPLACCCSACLCARSCRMTVSLHRKKEEGYAASHSYLHTILHSYLHTI